MKLKQTMSARAKERCCSKLCKDACYREDIKDLREDAQSVDAQVRQTWPPTRGGEGFSAFSAKVTHGGRDVLVVIFRGTHNTPEWLRYPSTLRPRGGLRSIEGLQVFSVWADVLNKVTTRLFFIFEAICDDTLKGF